MVGKYEKVSALADQDGDDIVNANFRAGYNATTSTYSTVTVVNTLTTLT